jgi:hypothetical protein
MPARVENFLYASVDKAAGGIHRATAVVGRDFFDRIYRMDMMKKKNPVNLVNPV